MLTDQSNKRPRTTSGPSGGDARDARIDSLESEVHALRSESARVRQQLQCFGQQLQLLRGNHDVLPLVVHSPTVDLSRFDAGLVSHISSFVGTSRELLNLALTCKSFGWRQPESDRDWSLAEEVAREAVSSGQNDIEGVRFTLPQYVGGTTTWLSILHRFESPLVFDVLIGGDIEHQDGDQTRVKGGTDYLGTALSSSYVMTSGAHYAEYQITGTPYIGIVRPMPGLDANFYEECFDFISDPSFYPDFLAQGSDDWGDGDVHACDLCSCSGTLSWTDWDDEVNEELDWEGMEACQSGDTVGMLLNLDEGTLTVYKNNRCLGVLKDGLSGPYCWYVTLGNGDTVAIKKGTSQPALQ